ncbi:hypothetical protein [Pseudoalteromonas sp. MMG012]|uniref:hypothetical protein n=1 Tax=Pseudoalteromonas sp. MMG012 TaxID=2822686 RepID=UPI001B3A08DA|nr:hypothetical protein [Pseudoalteromonas sp. MMG012]MBQ4848961.1 hypothetical protein [Pseudoalteromonas sp. MMG012]
MNMKKFLVVITMLASSAAAPAATASEVGFFASLQTSFAGVFYNGGGNCNLPWWEIPCELR